MKNMEGLTHKETNESILQAETVWNSSEVFLL